MGHPNIGKTQRWKRYYDPVKEISKDLPAPILGVMLLIWQLRDADLQQLFPLDSIETRIGFLTWCACHGRKEYAALAEASDYWSFLASRAELPDITSETDPAYSISKFMLLIKLARRDLPFDLGRRDGRSQFVTWYLTHGREELGIDTEPLLTWQVNYFNTPSVLCGLNCLQMLVYESRPDLHAIFPLPEMNEQFIAWFKSEFANRYPFTKNQLTATLAPNDRPTNLSSGVNVIGYAFGQLGIGEDARMATKSLIASGTSTTLINFAPGHNIPQREFSMSEYVRDDIVYDVNMFCLTAIETGRYFAKNGCRHFLNTFNIGYWPWELEEWPEEWQHLFSLVDEVWASSMHTYKSVFSNSPVPVKHVPMAVSIPDGSKLGRKDFGLPDNGKLFLFSFDLNSSANRKNPAACVEAFLMAFPYEEYPSSVGLVIKVHPPTDFNSEWEKLKSLRASDPRIYIIESTLDRNDLVALYKACDCFISLHRAEGFGRNLAESMLLETPVITTAYSGNLDYTNHTNAYMVNFRSILLKENDYPYGAGKFWAEPDIVQASKKMRNVVEDPEGYERIASNGRRQIELEYSFETVGARYSFELNKIRRSKTIN